jgi:alpha-L-rhamnosidase
MRSAIQQQRQSAYQILVAGDSALLARDQGDVWDSRKVTSSRSAQIVFRGKPLRSFARYYWKVRIWDAENRISSWSPVSCWTMGILHQKDWKAQWIGDKHDTATMRYPVPLHNGFVSMFSSKADTVKWILLDLGKPCRMDEIRLYPTRPIGSSQHGYLFPRRFRIEVSANRNFSSSKTVADHTQTDVDVPADYWKAAFPVTTARFVRLYVNKLAGRRERQYGLSLAELAVLFHGKNIARQAKVEVSDTNEQGEAGWGQDQLVDGELLPSVVPAKQPSPPSPLLRKSFLLNSEISKATLYVSALGLYELFVNGQRAGNQVLAPEWTDYSKRIQYQACDVTSLLRKGENVIGAILADGWWVGPLFTHPARGVYGLDRRLIARLEIEKKDGSRQVVVTDSTWKITSEGPVRAASIYDGEYFDGRWEIPGWNCPEFEDSRWQPVETDTSIHIPLTAQMNEPVRVIQSRTPVQMRSPKPGIYLFDMGQNIVGWCRLHIPHYSGGHIILRHGEMLNDDGTLYTANLRGASQIDSFISNPGDIVFEPRFTYHGFRYVEITGLDQKPGLSDLTGEVVSADMPQSGYFSCSDSLLNRLWENILWTQRDNQQGIPTDCPQRDERLGWAGDAQVFSQTAIYNFDMAAFYSKWIKDIRDGQQADGRFPDFAPPLRSAASFYNSPGWADAGIILPWRLYQYYGDTRVLEQQYPAMVRYITFIRKNNPDLIWKKETGYNYGDWLNGDHVVEKNYPKEGGQVPDEVYSTAFFAYSTGLLAKTAAILGRKQDASYFKELASAIRKSFNRHFVNAQGEIKGNTQAGYALALAFDLLPPAVRPLAITHLIASIDRYDGRMSTGIQSTIRLMEELAASGQTGLAYRLLQSHRFPSWFYSLDQGATTIWERWDGYVKGRGFQNPGMNSFNHYAFGAIGQWLYRHILGIQVDEEQPGYRHFIIKPLPGGHILWARGSYHSMQGVIGAGWQTNGDHFTLEVSIPVNSTATIYLPLPSERLMEKNTEDANLVSGVHRIRIEKGAAVYQVGSGKYVFRNF